MRFSSLSFLAFSFSVDRGIVYSFDSWFSRGVMFCSFWAIVLMISSWLSFRVRRIRLRRSSAPLNDIGVDALPSRFYGSWFWLLNCLCCCICFFGVYGLFCICFFC